MAASSFFGHFFLGIGPGIAFFIIIIAPKSFVVLLSAFSAFLWLVVMLITSAIFRGFVPLPAQQPSYAGALLAAVAIEEAARIGVWQLHKRISADLHRRSAASGHSFTKLDELYLALGWGYGQAAIHVLFLFASLLPLTVGHGTVYNHLCPDLSMFTVGALNSLGFGATLVALSVVSLEGWSRGSLAGIMYAPLMHAGAALLTLSSMKQGGCVTGVAAQLALGGVNTWYATVIAWRQAVGGHSTVNSIVSSGGPGPETVAPGAWRSMAQQAAAADFDSLGGGGSAIGTAGGLGGSDPAAVLTQSAAPPARLRSRAN